MCAADVRAGRLTRLTAGPAVRSTFCDIEAARKRAASRRYGVPLRRMVSPNGIRNGIPSIRAVFLFAERHRIFPGLPAWRASPETEMQLLPRRRRETRGGR